MNLLEYFDEEYSKVQKAHGSISAAIMQANDIVTSLTSSYKKLLEIKPDVKTLSEISDEDLDSLLTSLNSFIKDCKDFTNDLNLVSYSINKLKED